jgi:hypothetical protein
VLLQLLSVYQVGVFLLAEYRGQRAGDGYSALEVA